MQTTISTTSAASHTALGSMSHTGAGNKPNEDACEVFFVRCGAYELYAAIVADGVTSTGGGAKAAQLAVHVVRRVLTTSLETLAELPTHAEIRRLLDDAIGYAEYAIKIEAQSEHSQRDMSTTLVLALVVRNILYVAHAGDSRAYLCRRDNIHQLTIDHSYVEQLVREGALTREAAQGDPRRSGITRYLGPDLDVEVDHTIIMPGSDHSHEQMVDYIELQSDDLILLCTDGLTKKVTDKEIHRIAVRDSDSVQQRASALVQFAVQHKKERDNVTVALIKAPGAHMGINRHVNRPSPRMPVFLSILLAALFVFTATASWASQRSVAPVASPIVSVREVAIAATNTPILMTAPQVTAPVLTLVPVRAESIGVKLPTATATLVPLPSPTSPRPPFLEVVSDSPTLAPSISITPLNFAKVAFVDGFGVNVIIDSSVLSTEIGSDSLDICLEILDGNGEQTMAGECENLWDAFSLSDEDLDDIGCSKSGSLPEIVCAISDEELIQREFAKQMVASKAVINFYALKTGCRGDGCRDRLLAREELMYP